MSLKGMRSPKGQLLRTKTPPICVFRVLKWFLKSFWNFTTPFFLIFQHFPFQTPGGRWNHFFRARPRHRPTGSCHIMEISMATPRVQHPRCGQRHRPVESHDSLRRFSPDKGTGQSQRRVIDQFTMPEVEGVDRNPLVWDIQTGKGIGWH